MNLLLHKICKVVYEKRKPMLNMGSVLRVVGLLMVTFMLAGLSANTVSAASGIQIYNYTTKKKTTYTDKQVKVTFKGKKISKDKNPGILVNGVALVSYKDIFANKSIGADSVYNKAKGTVTIKKSGTTIVLTINSKIAKVNGKSVTMSAAPVKIKYYNTNTTKILVPSRFVSETLGYNYVWTSANSTVAITEKKGTSANVGGTATSTTTEIPLSYDGAAKFIYTGAQAKVTIDGKEISLGKMPSIIKNNTTMVRLKMVFADSSISATYKYDSKTKMITLTKGDIQLVMQLGSKAAYVNGKATTLDQAPMSVYNYNSKTSYIMVPGNNVANLLGYDYEWMNSTVTSVITTRKVTDSNQNQDNSSNLDPELSDTEYDLTGMILFEAKADQSIIRKSSGVHIIQQDEVQSTEDGLFFTVERSYSNEKLNTETYNIVSPTPFSLVTSSTQGQVITINTNRPGFDYTYNIYGVSGYLVNDIKTYGTNTSEGGNIEITVKPDTYSYDLSLSEDKKTIHVTIYSNVLIGATIGTNDKGDFINLEGVSAMNPTVTKQDNILIVEISNVVNGLGEQNQTITGGKYISLFHSLSSTDKTQIIFLLEKDGDITTYKEGNHFAIFIHEKKDDSNTSVEPNVPVTEVPDVVNPSKYNVVIPRPEGIVKSQLSDYDDYFNNRFYIRIQGDYVNYLQQHNIVNNASTVKDISIYLDSNNITVIQITTTKLQGYTYAVDGNNIYIKVGNPKDIYSNIVVLDPGHGGGANGARYFSTNEKLLNFKILYEIGSQYFNTDTNKVKAYYTRITDVDMTLSNRAAFAKSVGADLFISLHMNAATVNAHGTEVYYSNKNNTANGAGLTSKKMAEIFVKNISNGMGTQNRGAKAETYTVVHKNTVPAVLIELGFMSNANDFAILTDPIKQDKAAKIIYDTVLDIFAKYPTGR